MSDHSAIKWHKDRWYYRPRGSMFRWISPSESLRFVYDKLVKRDVAIPCVIEMDNYTMTIRSEEDWAIALLAYG
jgi:hypothetical protein